MAEGDWDTRKQEFQDRVLQSLFKFAPNLRNHILGCHTITPLDLERTYGITGGNIFHVAMTFEHMFSNRPLPELSDYRTPIEGLYLCGAGTHPGGGVSGAPGHNAAQVVLSDLDGKAPAMKPKGQSIRAPSVIDKVMKTETGSNIGYQFARSRIFRTFSRLALKTRGKD